MRLKNFYPWCLLIKVTSLNVKIHIIIYMWLERNMNDFIQYIFNTVNVHVTEQKYLQDNVNYKIGWTYINMKICHQESCTGFIKEGSEEKDIQRILIPEKLTFIILIGFNCKEQAVHACIKISRQTIVWINLDTI